MKTQMWVIAALAGLILAGSSAARADDLKRRGMLGVQLAPITDEVKTSLKLADNKGVLITGTVPNSAAAAAGILGNDVIVRINDDPIDSVPTLIRTLRKYGAGEKMKLVVLREGKETPTEISMLPRPQEQSTDYDIVYDSAGEAGKRVRTIITKPKKEGKNPAVLFIQGLAPSSVELSTPQPHPYKNIISDLTKAGFVTMRVERPGAGDSEGLDVQETTVPEDVAAFRAGLKKLKTYDYVDAANVFVFSQSSGGAIAPILAEDGVRGIATFAAFARPWTEHTADQTMRQWKLELLKEDEIKANLEKEKIIADELYVKKHSLKEALDAHPELKDYLKDSIQGDNLIYGMHYKYLQQLAGLDLVASWSKVSVPVLAMWGESDFAASKADSELIASTVNKKAPGKAKFVALPKTDHSYAKVEDQEESFLAGPGGGGNFNPIVMETVINWFKEQMGSKSS